MSRFLIPLVFSFFSVVMLVPGKVMAQSDGDDGEEQAVKAPPKKPAAGKSIPFPFRATKNDGEYDLMIDLKDNGVKETFKPVFLKNGLNYSAAVFEEIIMELIETDPALANVAIISVMDDKILLGSGNPIYQQNLIRLLQKALQSASSLDRFLKRREPEEEG